MEFGKQSEKWWEERRKEEARQVREAASEKWREERRKEEARRVREAAEQVDMLVMDAAVMQSWRKRVRETLDSSRGIKTGEDLLAALVAERRNVGAYYTILALCHDDQLRGGVAPIITDDILNPQLCFSSGIFGAYYPRQGPSLLNVYLQHVMRDLDIGKTRQEVEWNEHDPDYISASDAVVTFTDNKLSLTKLSKMLMKPGGAIRYMKKGRRCKVHIADFRAWSHKQYPPDSVREDMADELLADRAARQSKIDRYKLP